MFWGLIQTKKDKHIKYLESRLEKFNHELGKYLHNNKLWLLYNGYQIDYTYIIESFNKSHEHALEEKQREDEIRRIVAEIQKEQQQQRQDKE